MKQIPLPQDPTLDEVAAAIAAVLPRHAAFDGWSKQAIAMAAADLGVDPAIANLAFSGSADMIDAWFAVIDRDMLADLPSERLAALPIRQRIAALIEARLALLAPHREALRRAMAVMAMPRHLPHAARLGWRAADAMWRAAGDVATDHNHYSKRTTLTGVYAATLLVFIDDESDNYIDTRNFLDRRIEGIMRFERAKGRLLGQGGERLSLARFIGRLRYPAI